MPSTILSHVSSLNAQAVVLMESGHVVAAHRIFEEAVGLLAAYPRQSKEDTAVQDEDLFIYHNLALDFHLVDNHVMRGGNADEHNVIDVFPYAPIFRFGSEPHCPGETGTVPEAQLSTCGALSLYNMALCHHLAWGRTPTKKSSQRLSSAVRLYKVALELLQSHLVLDTACSSLLVMVMAICTNLASLSHATGDLACLAHWMDRLQRVLDASEHLFDENDQAVFVFQEQSLLFGNLIAARAA